MSIELITQVRRRLDVSHGELLVAVELADAANDDGEGISVGVQRIADRSRQDERTVQRQLKRLREVGWLEIVELGSMRGGRGHATRYRINAAWIKGDILPGFPDFVPKYARPEKGDNLTPIGPKGCQTDPERVTKQGLKGDTALSPDPLTRIPSDARARATPTGSRATSDPKPAPEFDETASRSYWWRHAVGYVLGSVVPLGIASNRPTTLADLSLYARTTLEPLCAELTAAAIAQEREHHPMNQRDRRDLEQSNETRLNRDMKLLIPTAPADRAAAAVA